MRHRWCCWQECQNRLTRRVSGKDVKFTICSNARSLLVIQNPNLPPTPKRVSYISIITGFQPVEGGAVPSIRFIHNDTMSRFLSEPNPNSLLIKEYLVRAKNANERNSIISFIEGEDVVPIVRDPNNKLIKGFC